MYWISPTENPLAFALSMMSASPHIPPPGKISVARKRKNRRSLMVTVMPWSRQYVCGRVKMLCNSIEPSSGRMSYARSKNAGQRSFLKASNASKVTIRSTFSSNSSQPCSRASARRVVGISASLALLRR